MERFSADPTPPTPTEEIMIVVTTPAGTIGHQVLEIVLDSSEPG
jgi:hypothetical protein